MPISQFYERSIESQINSWLFQSKVIILYGARQVGKTTLAKKIISMYPDNLFLECERNTVKEVLESQNVEKIISFFAGKNIIVLDEAQKVNHIGVILKLLIDTNPDIQIIATGSSSFDLANKLNEPLTGRNIKFLVYPLSLSELQQRYNNLEITEKLEELLKFGNYPAIINSDQSKSIDLLDSMNGDYLYRDVLMYEQLKNPTLLRSILKALALQIGSEVSTLEIAKLVNSSTVIVQKYLDLLEQSFVIFKLTSFSRNLRKEIKNKFKIYFYDLGIRNSIIQAYQDIENRSDIGGLWENFCILERLKLHQKNGLKVNMYFWKTYQNLQEIDLIEEANGELNAFEIKWNANAKIKQPRDFLEAYQKESKVNFNVINKSNWWQWLV